MIQFSPLHPALGVLPMFFSEQNPAPAAVQLDDNYQHGGGWRPMKGWPLAPRATPADPISAQYPGDPPLHEVSRARLRDELIVVFPHAWVAIIQPYGRFEMGRVD